MTLAKLEKRVRALEGRVAGPNKSIFSSGRPMNASTIDSLHQLTLETWWLKDNAAAAGDYRMAVVCMRAIFSFLELQAKLRGELREIGPANVVNVNIDAETATKIAKTYLERRKSLEGIVP